MGNAASARPELLERLRAPRGLLVAGLLSGTSCDGVDVALCRARLGSDEADLEPPELLVHATRPFEELPGGAALRGRLLRLIDGRGDSLAALATAHRDMALACAAALESVERESSLRAELVGSHGQTVWHHDGVPELRGATLQLGDLSTLAERSARPVVGDFRWRDLARGGEGAPLVALVDHLIFPALPRPAAILNLGGIANLTLLGRERGELLAFDSGPANCVLDTMARLFLDAPCDVDGATALRGRVDEALLARWLAHPYFALPAPKSTGRDTFSRAWVEGLVASERATRSDAPRLFATAVELVARTIADALRAALAKQPHLAPVGPLVVAGGGVRNPALLEALRRHVGPLVDAGEVGPAARAREGLLFALLAARHVAGIPSTHPGATKASAGGVLGVYAPPC
ncbi:MAG: anhydro-N-acetylmuramic acid kinase [Planctomycetota bacterium]